MQRRRDGQTDSWWCEGKFVVEGSEFATISATLFVSLRLSVVFAYSIAPSASLGGSHDTNTVNRSARGSQRVYRGGRTRSNIESLDHHQKHQGRTPTQ